MSRRRCEKAALKSVRPLKSPAKRLPSLEAAGSPLGRSRTSEAPFSIVWPA